MHPGGRQGNEDLHQADQPHHRVRPRRDDCSWNIRPVSVSPSSESCVLLVDGYIAGRSAGTLACRDVSQQFLHYRRTGYGSVTNPQTRRGYTAFVHTKISHIIGAGSLTDKMERDASVLQDEADGIHYQQEWEGVKLTAPIISGGMNALRLPAFFENLGHST